MSSTHANHDADEEEYLQLPKARRLDNAEAAEVLPPPPDIPNILDGWPLSAQTVCRIMLVDHNFEENFNVRVRLYRRLTERNH